VILAGGDGTRLKSLTRRMTGDDRPKQFCPVTGDLTLVQETQRRVALELPKEKTVFVLNRLHEAYYSKILCSTSRQQSHRAATKYRHGTCHSR